MYTSTSRGDVLETAARVTDAAAASAKFEIQTMQAAECVVCTRLSIGCRPYQDYYSFEGVSGRGRKAGTRQLPRV